MNEGEGSSSDRCLVCFTRWMLLHFHVKTLHEKHTNVSPPPLNSHLGVQNIVFNGGLKECRVSVGRLLNITSVMIEVFFFIFIFYHSCTKNTKIIFGCLYIFYLLSIKIMFTLL